jgi:hypothetical protein
MASVKWLTRVHAVREPFLGYWQTSDYGYWDDAGGPPVRRALGAMHLKSAITRPRMHETLPPDQVYPVSGAAWAGETDVAGIAVSTDSGRTWADAQILDPVQPHAWRRWRYQWRTPSRPGRCTLIARATGADGSVQPDQHDESYGSYAIKHVLPVDVFVGARASGADDVSGDRGT